MPANASRFSLLNYRIIRHTANQIKMFSRIFNQVAKNFELNNNHQREAASSQTRFLFLITKKKNCFIS